ncbi:hypothetical protein [Streptacidiphilus jiangxiensis]|uniref:Uncharacterized protein n=1 Tax=Streptacidiphilus jiangxiensis TaxID=235985 RepID=A0A1H7HFF5_STRJI|nr:hypothetical protein [Streptacidiphilus jiangxiensis]SEK48928.1 hypothetical protein SAMN05414137_102189 [Streptacidiphilus jiangxiensis]
MKTLLITGAALTIGTLALTAGPAFAASVPSGGVVSVTSAKDASGPIFGGSDVHLSGTCPVDAVKVNGITSPFFAGGHATLGKTDPQAFTGTATVLPDIPAGSHGVTVSCTDKSGRTESFSGSFTVSPTTTPTQPTKPTTPATPTHPSNPSTPSSPSTPSGSGTVPSGAPDTGVSSGGGNGYVLPTVLIGTGVLAGGTVFGIWKARHQGADK